MSNQIATPKGILIGIVATVTCAANAQTVNWAANANRFLGDGGSEPPVTGAPDALEAAGGAVDLRLSSFSIAQNYSGMAAFMGVSQATMDRADFIAWEHNGGDILTDERWESARFVFDDGVNSLTVDYIAQPGTGNVSDPSFLGDGSILSAPYRTYFQISNPDVGGFYSFVLFDLPSNFVLSNLSVDIILGGTVGLPATPPGNRTPDLDAAGVVSIPGPSTAALVLLGGMCVIRRRR